MQVELSEEYLDLVENRLRAEEWGITNTKSDDVPPGVTFLWSAVIDTVRICRELLDEVKRLRRPKPAAKLVPIKPVEEGPPLFYVQDSRGYVGNAVSWWCPEGAGYTCHLSKVGLYTEKPSDRETDIMWPRELVDRAATLHVDMQVLRRVNDAAQAE